MQEELKVKIEKLPIEKLQDLFVELSLSYTTLKKQVAKQVEITDELIILMFKQLKASNLDKAKKANLRKIILELEASHSPHLFYYLKTFDIFK